VSFSAVPREGSELDSKPGMSEVIGPLKRIASKAENVKAVRNHWGARIFRIGIAQIKKE
jgi:hypothetical protein